MINYERNAEIRRIIAEGTKTNAMNYTRSDTPPPNNREPIAYPNTHISIDGTCVECGQGRYRFIVSPELVKKHAGQIREILTQEECSCGSYLWLISIPPANSRIDDMMV